MLLAMRLASSGSALDFSIALRLWPRKPRLCSIGRKLVLYPPQFLALCGEDKSLFPEVERRIASVNGTMVIRANQYKISQLVFSPTTQPAHIVRLAKIRSILVARLPTADLTFAIV